jgi:hypothetical protein
MEAAPGKLVVEQRRDIVADIHIRIIKLGQQPDVVSQIDNSGSLAPLRNTPTSIAKPVRPLEFTLPIAVPFVSLFMALAIVLGVLFAKAHMSGTSITIYSTRATVCVQSRPSIGHSVRVSNIEHTQTLGPKLYRLQLAVEVLASTGFILIFCRIATAFIEHHCSEHHRELHPDRHSDLD